MTSASESCPGNRLKFVQRTASPYFSRHMSQVGSVEDNVWVQWDQPYQSTRTTVRAALKESSCCMEGLPTFIMVEKEESLERVHTFITRVILTAYKAKLTIEPLNAKHVREGYSFVQQWKRIWNSFWKYCAIIICTVIGDAIAERIFVLQAGLASKVANVDFRLIFRSTEVRQILCQNLPLVNMDDVIM